jgi:cyclopropane-fatty-acyl-phospholipid synthase
MIEAVGPKNFRTYFKKVHELLKPGGSFCLQAIGDLSPFPIASTWMDKYIFPNGVLPSLPQLEAASRTLFRFEHLENIGLGYDRTLMEWWKRFDAAYVQLKAKNPRYNERFYRMWKFYLQGCAGLFRAQITQDWQILFSRV